MAAALGLAPAEDAGVGGGGSRSGEVGKTGGAEERHRLCRLCRLRRYNRYTGQGEETFGGREHLSLKMLGLGFHAFFFLSGEWCV